MVRLIEDVVKYINSRNVPVSRTELERVFELEEKTISERVAPIVKSDVSVQRVKIGANNKTMEVFISKKLKEEYGDRVVPRLTAKGLCLFKGIEQDVYPEICSRHCYSFMSCAKDLKAYFDNNKITWTYDIASSAKRRIDKMFKPARYSTSGR